MSKRQNFQPLSAAINEPHAFEPAAITTFGFLGEAFETTARGIADLVARKRSGAERVSAEDLEAARKKEYKRFLTHMGLIHAHAMAHVLTSKLRECV